MAVYTRLDFQRMSYSYGYGSFLIPGQMRPLGLSFAIAIISFLAVGTAAWLLWGVIIIIQNIRSGSYLCHQVLILAVAIHHTILMIIPLPHLGAIRIQMPPSLHPLHLDLGAPDAAYGYVPLATMPVSVASGDGDERPLCKAFILWLWGLLVARMAWRLWSWSSDRD